MRLLVGAVRRVLWAPVLTDLVVSLSRCPLRVRARDTSTHCKVHQLRPFQDSRVHGRMHIGLLLVTAPSAFHLPSVCVPQQRRAAITCSAGVDLEPLKQAYLGVLKQADLNVLKANSLSSKPETVGTSVALASVASSMQADEKLGETLGTTKWRAAFSVARPKKYDAADARTSKSLSSPATEYVFTHRPVRTPDGSVADGSFRTTIRLLFGLLRFSFLGSYRLSAGARMTLSLERLTFGLWSLSFLSLGIGKGSSVRNLLERVRGGKKGRPNVFYWHHADADIAVASGSSGRVALWRRA